MVWLRSSIFNLVWVLATCLLGLLGLPTLVKDPDGPRWLAGIHARMTIWLLEQICGLRSEIRGLEHLPAAPYIIAVKHQSAWETLVLQIAAPRCRTVVKKELLWLPVYGWYQLRGGSIPIDRKGGGEAVRKMVRIARRRAEEGAPIAIFPEGTRRPLGAPADYHPGVAALYRMLKLPVVPVAVNSGAFWGRESFLKQPGTAVFEILPPIEPGLAKEAFMSRLKEAIEGRSAELLAQARATRATGD